MYRVVFKHRPKENQTKAYVTQWKKGSDIIQQQKGARGTKLFRKIDEPEYLYAMAEWESKDARNKAIESIKQNYSNAKEILKKHETFLETHETLGEFELIAESNPAKITGK